MGEAPAQDRRDGMFLLCRDNQEGPRSGGGVTEVNVSLAHEEALIAYDPDRVSRKLRDRLGDVADIISAKAAAAFTSTTTRTWIVLPTPCASSPSC